MKWTSIQGKQAISHGIPRPMTYGNADMMRSKNGNNNEKKFPVKGNVRIFTLSLDIIRKGPFTWVKAKQSSERPIEPVKV